MAFVNLGAGTRTTGHGLNMDRGPAYQLQRWGLLRPQVISWVSPIVGPERAKRLRPLCNHALAYADLCKGLPLPDGSVQALYHCHLLEHLDRPDAKKLMAESIRVLAPGGLLRICVPDLKGKVDRYLASFTQAERGDQSAAEHDRRIASLYGQSVRRRSGGDNRPPPKSLGRRLVRFVETLLLGDARARGETHQWMYDALTLRAAFETAGFTDIVEQQIGVSGIAHWPEIAKELEWGDDNRPWAPNSLYMEGRKAHSPD
ncbi:MAG: class I SAM-dependent methyltransferase [Rhodospirillaceae bacterium]